MDHEYFWFIRSSIQGLHIAVYHTISCLLAPAKKKKEKTDHKLVSHNNSLLRRGQFGSVRINCLREPPKEKKKAPALKVISNLSNLIRSERCRIGWTISLSLKTKLFTQLSTQANH